MGLITKMLAKFADDTERRIDNALDFDFTCALDHMVGRMSKFYDDFNDAMKFIKDTVSDFKVIVPFNEANYLIISGSYYGIFSGAELLDLYVECPKEIREKIKPLLA